MTAMLKAEYDTMEDVPEAIRAVYSIVDGRARLTGVDGLIPEEDFEKIRSELVAEREANKQARHEWQERKQALRKNGLHPKDVERVVERRAELEEKLAAVSPADEDDTDYDEILETLVIDSDEAVQKADAAIDANADRARARRMREFSRSAESAEAYELAEQQLIDDIVEIERDRLERKREVLDEYGRHLEKSIDEHQRELDWVQIQSEIEQHGAAAGLLPDAVPDALELARHTLRVRYGRIQVDVAHRNPDGFVRRDTLQGWLRRCRAIRPHWFGAPRGESRRTLFAGNR